MKDREIARNCKRKNETQVQVLCIGILLDQTGMTGESLHEMFRNPPCSIKRKQELHESFLNPHGSVSELLPRGVTPGGGGVILQFCRAILTTRSSPQNTSVNNSEKRNIK